MLFHSLNISSFAQQQFKKSQILTSMKQTCKAHPKGHDQSSIKLSPRKYFENTKRYYSLPKFYERLQLFHLETKDRIVDIVIANKIYSARLTKFRLMKNSCIPSQQELYCQSVALHFYTIVTKEQNQQPKNFLGRQLILIMHFSEGQAQV